MHLYIYIYITSILLYICNMWFTIYEYLCLYIHIYVYCIYLYTCCNSIRRHAGTLHVNTLYFIIDILYAYAISVYVTITRVIVPLLY